MDRSAAISPDDRSDDDAMNKTFITKRRVQFAENDGAGVVHFSNYYRMMEEAEHAFWRSLGLSVLTTDGDTAISWPRVAASCEHFAPARFEDELELSLSITRMGDRSLKYRVDFNRDERCIATGRMTAVCCTMADGVFQSVDIPPSLRSKVAPFVTSDK